MRLGWYHPTAFYLRIFAIYINTGNPIVHVFAVFETKFPVKINFNESSTVGLFSFVKLIHTITTGPLAVIKLVKSVAKHLRGSIALRIQS